MKKKEEFLITFLWYEHFFDILAWTYNPEILVYISSISIHTSTFSFRSTSSKKLNVMSQKSNAVKKHLLVLLPCSSGDRKYTVVVESLRVFHTAAPMELESVLRRNM